jgi:hypothetical protein
LFSGLPCFFLFDAIGIRLVLGRAIDLTFKLHFFECFCIIDEMV